MMKTIHIRPKPVLIVVGISVCIILWMSFKHFGSLPMERRVLRTVGRQFYLEGKPFRILSGSIHYFRVVPEYWKDRLLKLKAMGLNTVETYAPWNLHEEIEGEFNFEGILDIVHFIKLAQSIGLYVIIRPGPYICAEWDLGGLPSWLLRDPNMKLRSMYPAYIDAVDKYFNKLLPLLVPLQFSNGGPIIAFQVENEYGNLCPDCSPEYMSHLRDHMIKNGLSELLFTSDGIKRIEADYYPEISGVLKTLNFQSNETIYLKKLQELQPDKPLMVTEFWPGWFDHWSEPHHKMEVDKVVTRVSNVLKAGASINFYMFHGGTNFGFMNGANAVKYEHLKYQPTVTSYDYDAPLSEAGDITEKFRALKEVMTKYNPDAKEPIPFSDRHERTAYENVEMQHALQLGEFLPFFGPPVETTNVMPMEGLPINNNGGQGYGFILYQTELDRIPKEIIIRKVSDRAQIFLDFELIYTTDAMKPDQDYIDEKELWEVKIKLDDKKAKGKQVQLDILVENMGRINSSPTMNTQRKGILGNVEIDGEKPTKWNTYPMEFKHDFFQKLKMQADWRKITEGGLPSVPSLYRGTFTIDDKPKDTFLHMKGWTKGVVFINGHNLGRYWDIGPQETLYLPSPWLRNGDNELLVFELQKCDSPGVSFVTEPRIIGDPVYRF